MMVGACKMSSTEFKAYQEQKNTTKKWTAVYNFTVAAYFSLIDFFFSFSTEKVNSISRNRCMDLCVSAVPEL